MALSCIVGEISDLLVENRKIFIPHLYEYLAPPYAVTASEFREDFYAGKTRVIRLRTVKKP